MSEWATIDNRPARQIASAMFGHKQDGSCCGMCGSTTVGYGDFKDELSRVEFRISLMCQSCQDDVFRDDDIDPFVDAIDVNVVPSIAEGNA